MPKLLNVGIKAAIVNKGKVLVLRRQSTIQPLIEFWDLPGGRIDNDESIIETLDRELKEEILNIDTYKVGALLHIWRHDHDFADGHGLVLVCYRVSAALDKIELSEEHNAYKWVDKSGIKTLKNGPVVLSQNAEKTLQLALS